MLVTDRAIKSQRMRCVFFRCNEIERDTQRWHYFASISTELQAKISQPNNFIQLFLFQIPGESVRCWTCSSDLNPICNDPFRIGQRLEDVDYYRDSSYGFKMENCDANTGATYPYLTSSKSACKKQKKYSKFLLFSI